MRQRFVFATLLCLLLPMTARAQDQDVPEELSSAFTLSSSEVFTTRDSPAFYLTFRHLTRLDFRVYRVSDPFKFFAGLRDPHQLGSQDRPVPQERSWIERIANWKAAQRRDIRSFFRNQVSFAYRVERRAERDQEEIAQRVTLNETSFAQVPLLNPNQLVTAWRELLPDYREAEMRRLPLEVKQPGVYVVEAVSGVLRAYTIVIVSDIGLVTKVSPGQLMMFAADRFSGEPKAGCDVQILANQQVIGTGQSNSDGIVSLSLAEAKLEGVVGLARCGDQVAATDPGAWFTGESPRQLVGYIYTDKPIYRPGHTVHVKSVLRWRERDAVRPFDRPSVELTASDANDKVVSRQTLTVDEFGAVQASFPVPATAALGYYSLRVSSGEQQATNSFEVQEYRRPEFEVQLTPATRFVVQGNDAIATIQARYYFGQPVANAKVRYVVNQQPYYSPHRWSDVGEDDVDSSQGWYGDDQRVAGELRLDAQGRGEIRVPLPVDDNGRDYSARIEAQVMDASSREITGNTIVHATHGPFLLAARVNGYIFRPSQSVPVTIRAVDYTGQAQADVRVDVALLRIIYERGLYSNPKTVELARTSTTTGADGGGATTLNLPTEPGSYRIRATTAAGERTIAGDTWLWVPGAQEISDSNEERYLELLADKRTYAPGDIARFVVRGDPISGPMLVTKEGQQVTWHRLMRPAVTDAIEVPIEAGDIGDMYVHIAFMRDGRLFRAERRISVPPQQRTLQITLTADRAVAKPQEPGVFTLTVTDAAGKPVRAQVSLGVIDEAVYAIRADETPDPVRFFYRREYSRVGTTFSRDFYFTGFSGTDRLQLTHRRRRPFTLADFKGETQVQAQVRKEFPDAIYWIGNLVTDAAGLARVSIKYPDSLTTWRLTARAITTDTLAGSTVARTTTTKDLIVRVITPRFLTEGDQVVIPTIAHNYLQEAKSITVTTDVRGLRPETTPAAEGLTITTGTVANGGERRDNWRYVAATPGTATVTAVAKTDTDSDGVELPLPILPYGLRREVGTSGSIAGAAEHTTEVTIPASSNTAARGIKVSLAPSLAGSLVGALDFLTSFPYGCTEQTLSSFIPNLMVRRTLTQLKLAPTERLSILDRQVTDGLKRVLDFQHDDGGWGWWKTDENHPFMTAYALYGLNEAQRAGYAVNAERVQDGARALAQMYTEYPRAEPDLKSYMAYVLRRVAPERTNVFDELWAARARMSSYGRAFLLLALDEAKDARGDELARELLAEAQTRGDVSWWSSERDPLLFDVVDTSVEATAMAVQALVRRDPTNATLERAVRWLMLNRRGGYWSTTKQTAMALYGLLGFLQARNETPQPFAVDVFLNGAAAGSRTFTTASFTDPDPVIITGAGQEGVNSVRIVKKGGGAVYWSASATYYDTTAAQARSGSRELAITRRYARLVPVKGRDGNIVYAEQPLTGDIKPGDVLSIRLVAAGSPEWRYLMIEDPLPAGVEAIQDTTAYPMEREERWRWWWGSQVEYRDNRTVFFQESFEAGRYEFVYLVKAIASGEFRAVPAQISPMYVPDVNASSEPQTIRITVVTEGAP
jgi:uncharacterized protein YfaS (alpha-2-macroglobulin family)